MALLTERNIEPTIVEYLKTPPDEATIRSLLEKLNIEAVQLIRSKEHKALNLPETNDSEELIRRMATHPEIIERPIVVHGKKARLGRPPEQVIEIL